MLLSRRFSQIARGEDRGTAVVEMSLIVIALFGLLIGILDVGRAVFSYNTVASVARDATRYAIVHGGRSSSPATATDIENYVKGKLPGFLGVSVNTTWNPSNRQGHRVSVTVQYTYQPIIALFPSAQLGATSVMAMSY